MQTAQVSVGTTRVQLLATGREGVVIKHTTSGATVYIGGADVTSSNGWPMTADDPLEIDLQPNEPLYAVAASGTVTVYVMGVG